MNIEQDHNEAEFIHQAIMSKAPVELLGSVVMAGPTAMGLILFDALGIPLASWLYAAFTLLLVYLRKGGLSVLPRSQVDGIAISGERIQTPVRGLVNGLITLISAVVAFALLQNHLDS